MGQQVNVAVLKKQITDKITAIEKAQAHDAKAYETYRKQYGQLKEKYTADLDKWWATVLKAVVKPEVTGKATMWNDQVHLTIPDELVRTRPHEREDKYTATYPSSTVPMYYDARNKSVSTQAVLFHLRKALDLLDALPNATPEVTVKDFDFLTKY